MAQPSQPQSQIRRVVSTRVVVLWGAATLLCGARLVQLGSIVIGGGDNGPAYCKPEQRGEVVLTIDARNYSERKSIPLNEFLQGESQLQRLSAGNHTTNTSSSASEPAVCEWRTNSEQEHFSTAMEQIYRCWSFWQQFPDALWVLYRPPANHHSSPHGRQHQQNPKMRFVDGLIEVLEDLVHVTSDPSVLANAVRQRKGSGAFRMASPHDARTLAALVRTSLDIPSTTATQSGNSTQREPRIAVLNRHVSQKRKILNADRLARRIGKDVLGSKSHLGTPNSSRVEIGYFEDKSFREQAEFFMRHDIIISPHGAQLTGLAFMPECSAVLEVFPANYQNHRYFGSLVESAGLAHYSFGVGERTVPTLSVSQRETRIVRQVQLCPSRVAIMLGVKGMVEDWRECRRRIEMMQTEMSYAE